MLVLECFYQLDLILKIIACLHGYRLDWSSGINANFLIAWSGRARVLAGGKKSMG